MLVKETDFYLIKKVPNGMVEVLDIMYRQEESKIRAKIPMIKVLRHMATLVNEKGWNLKESKNFVEANWNFY